MAPALCNSLVLALYYLIVYVALLCSFTFGSAPRIYTTRSRRFFATGLPWITRLVCLFPTLPLPLRFLLRTVPYGLLFVLLPCYVAPRRLRLYSHAVDSALPLPIPAGVTFLATPAVLLLPLFAN